MFKKIVKYGEAEVVYKQKEELSKKPELKNLFWETTLRCNANCKHCGSRAGGSIDTQGELTTEEIKNAFKSIADKYDTKNILINVTGGEPLVRKDLFEVMEYAHNLGYPWGMTTNGILITDDVVEKMKKSGMSTISISIDGLEASHDEFRQVKGSYAKIIENIKRLKKANFLNCLQVTTVINKSNINELEELYEVMKDLCLDSWRVVNIEPIGRTLDNKNLLLDCEEQKRLFDFIKEKRKKAKFEITYGCCHFVGMDYEKEIRNNMYFCTTGFKIGSILYNGDIFVCPNVERRPELIQGNVRQDDFVEVWENKFEWFRNLDKFKKCEKCKNCDEWKYCLGDSVHSWDFEENKPKMCHKKFLKGE